MTEACIIGWSHSPFGRLEDPDIEALIGRVARAAIDDAGIGPSDVEASFVSLFNNGFSAQDFPASLVLQHVETDLCRTYLRDFARMGPAVYLLTRTDSDFGENVLELVAASGAYDAGPCIEVEHDEQTHQLRVVGRSTFDEARHLTASRHYDVLLRSR